LPDVYSRCKEVCVLDFYVVYLQCRSQGISVNTELGYELDI